MSSPGPLGPALSLLKGMLPLPVIVGNRQYDITTLHNFVDVAHGEQFKPGKGTSSGNSQEVEVVGGLVKALGNGGFKAKDICVFAGYRTQVKLLKAKAAEDQWLDCAIGTVDKSQGGEFTVIIISLVKTEGDAGFMEQLGRACVACSRHKIACYFVGKWSYWSSSRREQAQKTMSRIIDAAKRSKDLPELVVSGKTVGS